MPPSEAKLETDNSGAATHLFSVYLTPSIPLKSAS